MIFMILIAAIVSWSRIYFGSGSILVQNLWAKQLVQFGLPTVYYAWHQKTCKLDSFKLGH